MKDKILAFAVLAVIIIAIVVVYRQIRLIDDVIKTTS